MMVQTRLIYGFTLALLWAALPALAAPPPEPLRLLVSPATRTWSLQERVGRDYRTLLRDAGARVVRADGTEVEWTAIQRAPDGHSFTLQGPDMSLKVLAQWLDPRRLPATVSLLPIVYAKKEGVQIREVRVLDGALLPTVTPDAVVYADGYQAWSRSIAQPLATGMPLTSWWLTGLHSRRQSCVAGYLSNVLGANSWTVSKGANGVALSDRSDVRRMDVSRVAGGTPLDAIYLSWGKSPTDMLAEYAAGTRVFTDIMDPAPAFTPQPIPGGWSSWYAFYGNVTQEGVVRNADAMKRLFGTRDVRLIQIDDGFQVAAGDWDTNARFPNGHRWLTDTIHARGYQAGVWIAPFAVGEDSQLYKEHPDWLLKDKDGKPLTRGVNARWGGTVYVLDPSLQPVRAWLRDLMRRVTQEWGYDYIKLDFLFFAMLDEGVMGGNMTPAQAYRAAMKAMRLGAGKDAYLLGCGAPIGPTIGLVNGNRIGPDVNSRWPQIVEAARDVAYRQWMHNVWWQNDPDTVNLHDTLTPDQARAWTAAVGLSGGLALLSNDLATLPDERMELAHMALPVSANGGRPPFGSRLKQAVRSTGMRLSDMWTGDLPTAPALVSPGGTIPLRPGSPSGPAWTLRTGDDTAWADPASEQGPEWRAATPGERWEILPGLAEYDGYAWYRVRFRMPAGASRQDMVLHLGAVNDVEETFVNGTRVGGMGTFPPEYASAHTEARRYTVPADLLRWEAGAENVIAIRVFDNGGYGGLTDLGAADPPSVWRLPNDVSPARITVAALFNWGESARKTSVTPASLDAAPKGKRVHVWDIWEARYLGTTTGSLPLEIRPTASRLLALAPDVGHPQLLGTDANVASGAGVIPGVNWDAKYRVLRGRSRTAPGTPFRIAFSVPRGYGLFRLDAPGAKVERLPSEDGSALFRITPERPEIVWTARYSR